MIPAPSAVGIWWFELLDSRVVTSDETMVSELIQLLADVSAVLYQERLFFPAELTVLDWRVPEQNDIEYMEVTCDLDAGVVPTASTLLDIVGSVSQPGWRPATIELRGSTEVDLPEGGRKVVSEAMTATGTTLAYLAVRLETLLDVWLPFDLRGMEQGALFSLNAPRLSRGLSTVAQIPGVSLVADDTTRFAQVAGTNLVNFKDAYGRVVPVLDEDS